MRGRRRRGDHWLRRLLTLAVGFVLGLTVALLYLVADRELDPAGELPPGEPPVIVTFSEPFLTAVTREALASSNQTQMISDVVVEAKANALVVKGNVELFGRRTRATTVLRPVLRDGLVMVEVGRTDFGQLPVPLERGLEDQINARLGALLANLPVTITGIRIQRDRGLTVTCRVDVERLYGVDR